MTNEEKIKAMSTKEMAKAMKYLLTGCSRCPAFVLCANTRESKSCLEKMEEWLKQEAKDEV